MKTLPLGPAMIDIAGKELSDLDRERLCHPLVGGIILFTRNYASREQLTKLCTEIHALREPRLLIAVDHEGGRVQRFREGFARLPAMRKLGELHAMNMAAALVLAKAVGYVLATELRECGVDFSFTPVLDLDYGQSSVIGDRSFGRDPAVVAELANALIDGLHAAGMKSCGKHFPGHGHVAADSHVAIPVDERSLSEIEEDIAAFRTARVDAIMPAHVIYPAVDSRPAGFSPVWLKMLRESLGFNGVIFSDDLSMEGASVAGGIIDKANAAWSAGCDMLLVCNSPEAAGQLLAEWKPAFDSVRSARVEALLPTTTIATSDYQNALATMQAALTSLA
ncbi:MAG TPA: beta-N-acetylhexosaminidase [Rhodocyclaceae bacterium]|nr:beta-N-acetylhexosaminidase [Rhodocyclaceae bacterium]